MFKIATNLISLGFILMFQVSQSWGSTDAFAGVYIGYFKNVPDMSYGNANHDCSITINKIDPTYYEVVAIFKNHRLFIDSTYRFILPDTGRGVLSNYTLVPEGSTYAEFSLHNIYGTTSFSVARITQQIDFLAPHGYSKRREDIAVCRSLGKIQ